MAVETGEKSQATSQKEFESLLNADFKNRKLKENEIIKATVTEIGKNYVVVDAKAKAEQAIAKNADLLRQSKAALAESEHMQAISGVGANKTVNAATVVSAGSHVLAQNVFVHACMPYMLELLGTARLLSRNCRTGRHSLLDRLSSCMCEWWSGHQHCRRWQSILVGLRFGSCR